MRYYLRLLNIFTRTIYIVSEEICRKIQAAIEKYDDCIPDSGQEMETKMVWPHFKVFWLSKDYSAGHSERNEKKR